MVDGREYTVQEKRQLVEAYSNGFLLTAPKTKAGSRVIDHSWSIDRVCLSWFEGARKYYWNKRTHLLLHQSSVLSKKILSFRLV